MLLDGPFEMIGVVGLGQCQIYKRGRDEMAVDEIQLDDGRRFPTEHTFYTTSEYGFAATDEFEATDAGTLADVAPLTTPRNRADNRPVGPHNPTIEQTNTQLHPTNV